MTNPASKIAARKMAIRAKLDSNGIQAPLAHGHSSLRHLIEVWPELQPHLRDALVLLIDAALIRSGLRLDALRMAPATTEIVNDAGSTKNTAGPPRYYAACRRCTAKWFSFLKPTRCPRCGDLELLVELRNMPWHETLHEGQHPMTTESRGCIP